MSASSPSTLDAKLEAHRFSVDGEVPSRGEIIKIRLKNQLKGPGSEVKSSAVTGATCYNYHSVLVVNAFGDIANQCLRLLVYPIPSYSYAPVAVQTTPQDWLRQQPQEFIARHIPVPSKSNEPLSLVTPAAFGAPLQSAEGCKNRRISWVFLEPEQSDLSGTWKRHVPLLRIPGAEVTRLEKYYHSIQSTQAVAVTAATPGTNVVPGRIDTTDVSGSSDASITAMPHSTTVRGSTNTTGVPAPSNVNTFMCKERADFPDANTNFKSLFYSSLPGNVSYHDSDDSDDSDDSGCKDADDDEGLLHPMEYLSLWGGHSETTANMISSWRAEREEHKRTRLMDWLASKDTDAKRAIDYDN